MRIAHWIIVLATLPLAACQYDFPEPDNEVPAFNPGSGDFSNLVILGGGNSAGFMDGSLHNDGQAASYPAILADQINLAASNQIDFIQPDIDSRSGWNPVESDSVLRGRYTMYYVAPDFDWLQPIPEDGEFPGLFDTSSGLHNFSVPGLRIHQVKSPELWNNPFYGRFGSAPGQSNLLDDLVTTQPSMVLVELGLEDIIAYASNGLTGDSDPEMGQIGAIDRTPADDFANYYDEIIDQLLTQTEAGIVLVNIPDVSQFPFFNSYGNLARIVAAEAGILNSEYYADYNAFVGQFNSGLEIVRPRIQFFSDDGPAVWFMVAEDPSLPDLILEDGSMFSKIRQMRNKDQLLWSTPQLPIGIGFGTITPIPKRYWIADEELDEISELVDAYNQVIAQIANRDERISMVDAHAVFEDLFDNDVSFDGVQLTPDARRTGAFSGDALYLNQRGASWFSNAIAAHLNDRFGSNILASDLNQFPGNQFQNGF